jgi:hypothetical protein
MPLFCEQVCQCGGLTEQCPGQDAPLASEPEQDDDKVDGGAEGAAEDERA